MQEWTNEDLLALGRDHGCMTGDCPHDDANACLRELIIYVGELSDEMQRQHLEIERLVRDHRKACDDWRVELELNARQRVQIEELRERARAAVAEAIDANYQVARAANAANDMKRERDECRRLLREAWESVCKNQILPRRWAEETLQQITTAAKAAGGSDDMS